MNIHSFQHAPQEGLGQIENWIREHGHALTQTHFYRGDTLPEIEEIDMLVIMGGGMNVYQYRAHPWLRAEKHFIERTIEAGKPVLGICLGAQLIADVLGAKVYQNREIEVGWWPVRFQRTTKRIAPFAKFPHELTPMHWHGDTFDLPPGAVLLSESDGCKNQAFAVGDTIIGLQFHLEVRAADIAVFLEDYPPNETGRFIQTREQILAGEHHLRETHAALSQMLHTLTSSAV